MTYRKVAAVAAIVSGLGIAETGLLALVPASATASSGVPPIVTETFGSSRLPCNSDTTVGMEGCGERKVLADDRQLNAEIRVIWDRLDASGHQSFARAQAAWLTYRRADCDSQSDVYAGGTEQPVAYVYCLASDDIYRHRDLAGFFAELTRAQNPKPRFP